MHFAPYSCVKMEAPGGATRVVVEFTAPGERVERAVRRLHLGVRRVQGPAITPATVWLEVNGQAQTLEIPVGDELMHRLEGPALPEGARVRIAMSSGNPTARVVCVVMTGSRRAP